MACEENPAPRTKVIRGNATTHPMHAEFYRYFEEMMPSNYRTVTGLFRCWSRPPRPERGELEAGRCSSPWCLLSYSDHRADHRPPGGSAVRSNGVSFRAARRAGRDPDRPFIHADTDHLLANTLPLLVVGTGLFTFYRELAFRVIALVWTFSGAWCG